MLNFITTLSYINFKRNYCIEIAVHYLAITLSICGVIAWISLDLQVCIYFYLSQSSMMLGGLELFFAQKIPILSVKTVHKYISVTPATPILSLCYIYESLLLKESVSLQEQDVCWGISPETLKIIPNKYYFYFLPGSERSRRKKQLSVSLRLIIPVLQILLYFGEDFSTLRLLQL